MKDTAELPLLMTASQIAKQIVPVSTCTLRRWLAAGLIEGRFVDGKWIIVTESFLKSLGYAPGEPPPKPKRGRSRKEAAK
jgi:hypothetical protein